MKKKAFILVLFAVLLVAIAGCAPGSVAQVNTPVPDAGTSAPNGEINVPGVSININAPGPNPMVNTPDDQGRVAGILMGLWHGIISPVTLLLSFLGKNTQIYEVHNDGRSYNLGFLLGILLWLALVFGVGSRR
ncbi:MAG TPA: hypothetical protein VGJ22_03330 [Anaerolineales bacterium]|jgi:hypothetical protein